jgi:hypothetical protein
VVVVRKTGRGNALFDQSKGGEASDSGSERESDHEETDDECDDRGAGASKRARAVVNDRRRLHLSNGFEDLNVDKFPKGLHLDDVYKEFFAVAKEAGNAVGCSRCLSDVHALVVGINAQSR